MSLKRSEWLVLVGLLLLSLVPGVGGLLRLIEIGAGASMEGLPANPRISSAPLPMVLHLVSSVPFCILGAWQFLPSFRQRHPRWHALAGRFVGSAGILSALSGLWMTQAYAFPEELQGTLLYLVRLLVGGAMTLFIWLGVRAVLRKDIRRHEAWMIRAYALGQGAGTQVLVFIPWMATVGEPAGLARDLLMTFAWLVNLFIAEWLIRSSRAPRLSSPVMQIS